VERQVDADRQQEHERDAEHETRAVGDAERLGKSIHQWSGQAQDQGTEADTQPEQGVALRQPAATQHLDGEGHQEHGGDEYDHLQPAHGPSSAR
jgi:hypothetical protein